MTVDTTALREQVAQPRTGQGKTIKQAVQEQLPQIAAAIPKSAGMTPERFTRLIFTEISRNPKLQECSVESFLGSMMYAAQLGIEPGPLGHVYIVPYKGKATLIIGYRGLIELARRSEKILTIEAREVCDHDDFEFSVGDDAHVKHSWDIRADRGPVVGYYGVAVFTNGGKYILPMSLADIGKRRERSMAKNAGPWVTDPEAMSLKTVIRAMQRFLPLTPEVATAFANDEHVLATFDPDAAEKLQFAEIEDGAPAIGPADEEAPVVDVEGADYPHEGNGFSGGIAEPDPEEPALGLAGDNYDTFTDPELSEACAQAGLSRGGPREAQIARLRKNDVKLMEPM